MSYRTVRQYNKAARMLTVQLVPDQIGDPEDIYTHKSGLEFDIGLIAGHDITVIMLYAIPEDNEPIDEGFWLVDYVWGSPRDTDDRDYECIIDLWLADKPESFIPMCLRRQKAARDKDSTFIFIQPGMIYVADCDWDELTKRIKADDASYEVYDTTDGGNYYRASRYAGEIDSALLFLSSLLL